MRQRETTWARPIGVLTAIAVPFLITGVCRLTPDAMPIALPFVVLFLLAISAVVAEGTVRAVGFGLPLALSSMDSFSPSC